MVDERILAFVKDSISKGYPEEEIRKVLIEHNIKDAEADELISKIKASIEVKVPEAAKPYARLPALLIVIAGVVLMLLAFIYNIYSESLPSFVKVPLPFMFPVAANVINFFLFRKRFLFGLIFTIIVVSLIVAIILSLAFAGF